MHRGRKTGGKPPIDDEVLYLDADESGSNESLDDILKEAQASAERLAERQRGRGQEAQGAKEVEERKGDGERASDEVIEETIIEEVEAPAAPRARLAELTAEVERLRSEGAELKAQLGDLRDQVQRRQAEFENFRKRQERDKEEFQRYAHGGLLKEILPVIDNLERALMVGNSADVQSLRQGVELVYRQLKDTLGRFGLKEVLAIGQEFDPNYHEAVASEPSSELAPNTVMCELQKGYLHHERLLRAACVKVALAPPPKDEGGPGPAGPEEPAADGKSRPTE